MAYYKDKKTGKTYTSPGPNRVQVAGSEGSAGAKKEVNQKRDTSTGFKASTSGKKTAGDIIRESRTDPNDPTTGSWARVSQLANAEEAKQKAAAQPKFGSGSFDGAGATGSTAEKGAVGKFIDARLENAKINLGLKAPPEGTIMGGSGSIAFVSLAGGGSVLKFLTGKTAVKTAAKVGTKGTVQTTLSGAPAFVVNTKKAAVTATWLTKLTTYAKNPAVVVGGLMAAVGSYPFAGFIKEEALQTLGFATRTATESGDIEGATAALEAQREVLDPGLWDSIMAKIPYANVLNNLKTFYEAARLKVNIDAKLIEDMKIQTETGETNDQKWARLRQEEADQDKAMVDYYNEQRKQQLQWEEEAADRDMKEDAAFWAAEREKQMQKEKEDREAIAAFWNAYRKEQQKIAEDNRPSNLNFGLI